MKVAFLTNFLTHHQTPFCNSMYESLGDNFTLIVMRSADLEQKKLGYKELNDLYPFVVKVYEGEEKERKALSICEEADVVILGSAPEKYVKKRLEQNKLTFIYTERIFKKGLMYAFYPPMIKHMFRKFTYKRDKNQYYLCAGGYVARDINAFTHTPEKFFKWGYFPEMKEYPDIDEMIDKKERNSIVWVARYIDWKHPEIAVQVGKRLLNDGYNFTINMIGNGALLEEIAILIEKEGLSEHIHLLGGVDSDKVREYMERSEIHIFTSDRQEGWGAVLNESMNSACAVVANKDIGAAPFLLKDGENGFVYRTVDELYAKVRTLLDNPETRKEISKNAYKAIVNEWNSDIATERLLDLCNKLLRGEKTEYLRGPCSNSFIN